MYAYNEIVMEILPLLLFGIYVCVHHVLGENSTHQVEQIHIAFGSSADKMVVMWASRDQVRGNVKYGNDSNNLSMATGSDVAELGEADYMAAKYQHRAELTKLTAGTQYFYRIASLDIKDGTTLNTSATFSFRTPPKDQSNSMKFIVYGDLGVNEEIPTYGTLEKYVKTDEYAAILHVGDFAYDLNSGHGEVGDRFMNKIQPFASRVPYMTCPGNHEKEDEFRSYRTRFSGPGAPWPIPVSRLWHSYDVGLVHFISYSTEVFFDYHWKYACTQFDWLLKDLTAANQNRDKTPWIIAIGHRPMYCANGNGDDCAKEFLHQKVKHGLEDLFHAQGVDLVIQGHEHSYERSWPVYDNKVTSYDYDNPRATTHIVSGAAGNIEGVAWMKKGPAKSWSAIRATQTSRFSFGVLEVHNNSHLNFRQINAENERVIDDFWLLQNNHGPFVPNVTCGGSSEHSSCFCPSPYFFIEYIIGIILAASVVLPLVAACFAIVIRRLKDRSQVYSRLSAIERERSFNIDVYQHFDNTTITPEGQWARRVEDYHSNEITPESQWARRVDDNNDNTITQESQWNRRVDDNNDNTITQERQSVRRVDDNDDNTIPPGIQRARRVDDFEWGYGANNEKFGNRTTLIFENTPGVM